MDVTTDASRRAIAVRDAADDWRGLGDLIELATERLTTPVEETHRAIIDRWFGLVSGDDSPDGINPGIGTGRIYGTIRSAGSVVRTSLRVGATAIGRQRPIRPLWESPVGAGIQAAVNALWGDELERRTSPMHVDLGIRDADGASVASDATSLALAFPTPTNRLVVLLHGLGMTEHCWSGGMDDSGKAIGLPGALGADAFTPVLLRYNTGRRVSDNGVALASLLEEVIANWPVAVAEIVLIGHSMGGLVARSSLHIGTSHNHQWTRKVRHIVGLGTPHFGSPIEKGAHLASQLLGKTTVSRPLGEFVDGRSAGIKDMRHGTIHDVDSREQSTDPSGSYVVEVPPIDGVQLHHAAGVVTGEISHPFGFLVGDLVVRVNSAIGIGSNGHVEAANVRLFGGLSHLGMLLDPDVHSQIREWLAPTRHASIGAEL
jgi:pimeloyl-ACP methyl ester carboxylesterase